MSDETEDRPIKLDPELLDNLAKGRRSLFRAADNFIRQNKAFWDGRIQASEIDPFAKLLFNAAIKFTHTKEACDEIIKIEKELRRKKRHDSKIETIEAEPNDSIQVILPNIEDGKK